VKVLLSWLRDYVDVKDSAEEIARTMSLRGFAVEGIEILNDVSADASAKADAVLDFEVTANRPDCMSMIGMAREVAVAYNTAVRGADSTASVPGDRAGDPPPLTIQIDEPDLCPRYVGAIADVTIGSSPAWMQARLQAAGIRPISNIVDVTNYVLLELGHPMHAFDLTRLTEAQIRVRPARAGETIRTLDGQTRTLSAGMLVIADAERPVAVAGVMGGADSEVSGITKTIVLESAYFNPLSVRRTSKKLGLKTEASMRFERGADPAMAATAMARAIALIEEIGAGRGRAPVIDEYPKRIGPRIMGLRRERIGGLLGGDVPDGDIERILGGLGFEHIVTSSGWDVAVPTRRVDVTREVDLIEEVARHYGFDRLPVTFPELTTAPQPPDPRIMRARHLRSVLAASGFSEAVTFGFVSEPAAAPFAGEGDLVPIANPLSENFAVLRPSVLPGLIDAIAHNRRREQRDIRLFEIGNRFSKAAGETRAIACAWTGAATGEHWSGTARQVDFFDMKAVAERISEAVGTAVHTVPADDDWLAPGRRAAVMANATRVGAIGQLAPAVADRHGLVCADPVYVAELDLDALEAAAAGRSPRVDPLPRYPSVTRDISILVADTLAAADIRATVRDAAPAILARVVEFDRYQGKGVPEGQVSLSLRLTFRSSDRTLTDAEVQAAMDAVLHALKNRHAAVQR
jgi:phenylalanyl-tRNA synthetase beta chain